MLHHRKTYKLRNRLAKIGTDNVIIYYLRDILIEMQYYIYGRDIILNSRLSQYNIFRLISKVSYSKRLDIIILLSPFLFILYDCIFHDYVLSSVYYYLLLYIPMMTLKHITTCAGTSAGYVVTILYDMYYKDEDCIYALSSSDKRIFDIYLLNGLRFEGAFPLDVPFSLYNVVTFHINDLDRDAYMNSIGEYIKIIDNRVFRELEVDDGNYETTLYYIGEEWVLLADKRKKK